jgi:hypothetical protein
MEQNNILETILSMSKKDREHHRQELLKTATMVKTKFGNFFIIKHPIFTTKKYITMIKKMSIWEFMKWRKKMKLINIYAKWAYSLFTKYPVRIWSDMDWFYIKGKRRSKLWIVMNNYITK